jgi:hypothetical protein
LELDSKAAGIVAAAVIVAFAAAGCGSAESIERHTSPARVAPSPAVASTTCKTGKRGTLEVHGVSCSTAEQVVRGFAVEGGSPGAVLTVDYFVCEERGRRLTCARGTAGIAYMAPRP